MKTPLIALTILVFLNSGIATYARDEPGPEARLLQADRDFARLSEESDPKHAFAAYLAPNAIMLPRAGSPVEGYDNAIASFGEKPGYELLWQPQLAEVAASGEMGWTWGIYQVIVDGKQVSNGKYVNIWALQADGSWKVRMDMGNQEPARETSDENPQPGQDTDH
jgi:ketosteroid isomerase-like protein